MPRPPGPPDTTGGHGLRRKTGTGATRKANLGVRERSRLVSATKEGSTAITHTSISVVICAYTDDRWGDLAEAVASVLGQSRPPAETIVVIDHNAALLERVRRELTGVRAVENVERQGLSGARNSGVAVASGDIVAFLDDDAVAEPDWLEHLVAPYHDSRVLGVGGEILPRWQSGRPRYFPTEFQWVVGCSYTGLPEERRPVRNLIGANMSVRRDILTEVGGFSSVIGRVGTRPVGCEETELCIRARQRWPDSEFVYEPGARVHHSVPLARSRVRYFASRCWFEGISKAVVARAAGARDGLASERSYTLRTLPLGVVGGVRDALHGDLGGLARAAAILTGLGVTTAGYLFGVIRGVRDAGGESNG